MSQIIFPATSVSQSVAAMLLEIEAIKLNVEEPFTWASGWRSPIYCDNRLALSYPVIRTKIKEALADVIKANYNEVEVVAGVATAGIPQGVLVADMLGLPFIYIRSKPKGHGMENMIEGHLEKGQKVVLVEDLVSTGGSSLKAAEAVSQAGGEILGMAAIFTYGFHLAEENFGQAGIKLCCLSHYGAMIEEAVRLNYITEDQVETLKAWRVDPANWL